MLPRLPAYTPIRLHQNPIHITPPNRRRRSSQRRRIIIRCITPRNTPLRLHILNPQSIFFISSSTPKLFSHIHLILVNLYKVVFTVWAAQRKSGSWAIGFGHNATAPTAVCRIDFGAGFTAVFGVGGVVGGLCGGFGPELFADLELERADCGCAGDHDANVSFDGRPVADRQVIPGYVIGVGELDEVFEAEDADDGDAVSEVSMWIFKGVV
jgi:hypothetical protein